MIKLTQQELNRYNRQLILPELGIEGQEKLKNASVLFVGAGGLGCPALQYLAAAGIGKIGIVDFDNVDESNLHRQILFNDDDLGRNKALVAAEKLSKINPNVEIKTFPIKLEQSNAAAIIRDYDLILDGSDNFTTRYLVNDVCVANYKTWVFGSIFKFEGQVSVFNYKGGNNYRSVFPEAPDENSVPNCAEIGVIGVLPGIIGLLMANEAIKVICGRGETLADKLLVYDALDTNINVYQLKKSENNTDIEPSKTKMATTTEIDFSELESLGEYLLLDVREEWEFEDFNKGGVNIPLSSLPEKIALIENDQTIICCCSYGGKSKIAVKLINDKYPEKKVYSIKNGIEDC